MIGAIFRSVQDQGHGSVREIEGPSGQAAPGTKICFDPELLHDLEEEHLEILGLLDQMEFFGRKSKLIPLQACVRELDKTLQAHRLKEEIRLIIYLERKFQRNAARTAAIREFKQKKEANKKEVRAFLDRYSSIASHPVLLVRFPSDLRMLGGLVVRQIEHEEQTIYPLYYEDDAEYEGKVYS